MSGGSSEQTDQLKEVHPRNAFTGRGGRSALGREYKPGQTSESPTRRGSGVSAVSIQSHSRPGQSSISTVRLGHSLPSKSVDGDESNPRDEGDTQNLDEYERFLLSTLDHRKRVFAPNGDIMFLDDTAGTNSSEIISSPKSTSRPSSPKQESPKEGKVVQEQPSDDNDQPPSILVGMCRKITSSRYFSHFMTLVIASNIFILGFNNSQNEELYNNLPEATKILDMVFCLIYISEASIKIISNGVYIWMNPYFLDPWNKIDFAIAILSISAFFPSSAHVTAFRILPVVKPIRLINSIPGMKLFVNSLLTALSKLMDVGFFMLLIVFLFAVIGVQLWAGKLSGRCYQDGVLVEDDTHPCDLDYGMGRHCSDGQECLDSEWTPIDNKLDFDNIGRAYLTILVLCTVQGWIPIVEMLVDSKGPMIFIYLIVLLTIITIIGLNLTLAVLNSAFINAQDDTSPFRKLLFTQFPTTEHGHANPSQENARPNYEKLKNICHKIASKKGFKLSVIALIIINTAIMATQYYGAPSYIDRMISVTSNIFTILFALELLINVLAHGIRKSLKSKVRWFDFIVVFLSLVDLLVIPGDSGLRAVYLLRIFRLAEVWPSFRRLLNTLSDSLHSISLVTILLVLFIVTYAISGYQLFYDVFPDNLPPQDRSNFQTVYQASLTVFQIITGDNWTDLMLNAMEKKGWASSLFFVSCIMIGNYVILNLFLAVILEQFALATFKEKLSENRRKRIQRLTDKIKYSVGTSGKENGSDESPAQQASQSPLELIREEGQESEAENKLDSALTASESSNSIKEQIDPCNIPDVDAIQPGLSETNENQITSNLEMTGRCGADRLWLKKQTLSGQSVVSDSGVYRKTINALIILSSILLIWFNPNNPLKGSSKVAWITFESMLLSIFMMDILLNMFVNGGLHNKKQSAQEEKRNVWLLQSQLTTGFFQNPWNIFDLLTILASLISLLDYNTSNTFVKTCYFVRSLRPLRLIYRIKDIRIIVGAMIHSVPNIMNLVMVIFMFFVVFSIISMYLFSGKFYSCNDPEIQLAAQCVGIYISGGHMIERDWSNAVNTFDSTIASLISWFQISTYDNWHTIMYQAVDAYRIGHQPKINYNIPATVPFLIFQLMVGFFLVSVFLAILIDTFNQIREEMNEQALLSPEQREWVNALELITNIRPTMIPHPPKHPIALICFNLANFQGMSYLYMILSGTNFIIFSTQHARPTPFYKEFILWSSVFFFVAYALEAIVKLIAFSPRVYFSGWWNRIDFLVVIGSIIEISLGHFLPVCAFRMIRVVSFFEKRNDLRFRIFYRTIIHAIPSLTPVALLLLIVFFVYGFIGVLTFGDVENGDFIDDNFNFRSFFNALMTMGVIVSGDQWTDIIADCLNSGFNCDPDAYGCGSKAIVYTFFVSFQFFIAFILLNLFATVILESYGRMNVSEESAFQLYHCNQYKRAWAYYDPKATGIMSKENLVGLLRLLGPPLGTRPGLPLEEVQELISRLNIPITESGHIMFHFTLHAITQHLVGTELPSCQLVHNLEEKIYQIYERQVSAPPSLTKSVFTSLRQITKISTKRMMGRHSRADSKQTNKFPKEPNDSQHKETHQATDSGTRLSAPSTSRSFVRSIRSSEISQIEMIPIDESQIQMDFQGDPAIHSKRQKDTQMNTRIRAFSGSASHLSIKIPSGDSAKDFDPGNPHDTHVTQFTPVQATPGEAPGFTDLSRSLRSPQSCAHTHTHTHAHAHTPHPPTPDLFLPHQALSDSIRTANKAHASSSSSSSSLSLPSQAPKSHPRGATASGMSSIRSQPTFSPMKKRTPKSTQRPRRDPHSTAAKGAEPGSQSSDLFAGKAQTSNDTGAGVAYHKPQPDHAYERVLPEPRMDLNHSQDNLQQAVSANNTPAQTPTGKYLPKIE